ncbi:MAG: DUF6391 domain-containing protein [Anaerolineae bacterium]|nr:DUF6391 domain-containing protein [Anaerolineae bacterium]
MMLKQLAEFSRPALEFPYILRTRRNHGLEHASIHILSTKRYRLSGRSDDGGFVILGDVPTEAVENAVNEALRRMKAGEHNLAVHPNCGTNLVTTASLASLVGLVGLGGSNRRDGFNRLPTVMTAMMIVLLYSPLLGMALQRHFTTEGDPGDMEVLSVTRNMFTLPLFGKMVVHRVNTRSS